MTPFAQGHPGGYPVSFISMSSQYNFDANETSSYELLDLYLCTQRLLMAAGQDLEPYWDVYRQHLRGHVVEWIEKYRIGNLSAEEAEANKKIPFGGM